MKKFLLSFMIFCSMILLTVGVGIFSVDYQANLFARASAQEVEVFKDTPPQDLTELQKASDGQLDYWASKLEKFDGREYNYITPVRDQSPRNTCWAYAAVGAAEASILRNGIDTEVTNQTLDLDETITAYNRHVRDGSQDPLLLTTNDTYNFGTWNQGDPGAATAFSIMTQGYTLLDENNFNTSVDVNKIKSALKQSKYYVKSYQNISSDKNSIKRAILQYGAVTFNYAAPTAIKFYKPYAKSNHTSIIVGWDDNIKTTEFGYSRPKNDGAWIIKNSWGSNTGENGYFYISYEQPIGGLYSIEVAMQKDYQNIYHYDGNVTVNMAKKAGDAQAAIYEAKLSSPTKQEQLKAVMIYVPEDNLDVNVKIYKNLTVNPGNVNDKINNPEQGDPTLDMNTKIMRNGMHTIDLQEPINLEQGEYFSIVIRCTGSNGASVSVKCAVDYNNSINDMTYYLENNQWISFKSSNYYADSSTGDKTAKIRAITNTVDRITESEKDLQYARVEIPNRLVYYEKGKELLPEEINVLLDGKLLENERDYKVKVQNIISPGKTEIIIAGNGNYSGTRTTYFEVAKAKFPPGATSDTINVYNDKKYLKDIPTPEDWKWENENQQLKNGYTSVSMTYVGEDKEFYQNTTCNLEIYKLDQTPSAYIDISSAQVEIIGNYFYTGKPIKPVVKVTLENIELNRGTDFEIEDKNNIAVGQASVIVKGINAYKGTKEVVFTISKAEKPKVDTTLKIHNHFENLSEVELPDDFEWVEDSLQVISETKMIAKAIYKGSDANSYETTELTFEIVIEEQEQNPHGNFEQGLIWLEVGVSVAAVLVGWGIYVIIRRKKNKWWKQG